MGDGEAKFIASVVAGYVMCGIANTISELNANVVDKRGWARNPTLPKILFFVIAWPIIPFVDSYYSAKMQLGRGIAYGLLQVLSQVAIAAGLIFGASWLAALITKSTVLHIVLTSVILAVVTPFVLAIVQIPFMILTLLLAFPIELLFPDRRK